MWNDDHRNFGTTLHLVDDGVDTGPVLAHIRAEIDSSDNFSTYPVLQQAASLPELVRVLQEVERGIVEPLRPERLKVQPGGESRQWYHPTLLQYLTGRLRGVK